jgi:single-strand DNA-binding protein
MNKAMIIGYLGRDPDARTMPSGEMVANINVATTERWKDKTSGEKREATEWHRIVFFGRQAEIAAEYLKKGSHVAVVGALRTRKWTDRDGIERYSTEIVARELEMLARPVDEREPPRDQTENQRSNIKPSVEVEHEFDDAIPFD